MRRVLLVEWFGRGGITQATQAWADLYLRNGFEVRITTRPAREVEGVAPSRRAARTRVGAHAQVVAAAASEVAEWRPDVVIVQGTVLPFLERRLVSTCRKHRVPVILVVHDDVPHGLLGGTLLGQRSIERSCDVVVAHSQFVARHVEQRAKRRVEVVPLPIHHVLVDAAHEGNPGFDPSGDPVAAHFGVVRDGYKGTKQVLRLAAAGVEGWRFAVFGRGAPARAAGVICRPGYLPGPDFAAAVQASAASLMPYRTASQSGAVLLAQCLGSVAVASAVGGLPEQIEHGETGMLVPPGAGIDAWRGALIELRDPDRRGEIADHARARAKAAHVRFQEAALRLVTELDPC